MLSSVASLSVTRVGSMLCSLWLSFWLTCCIAWPTQYRRSYQYFPPLMTEMGPPNQWDIAQEPVSYEQPEDYYDNSQWADVEALSNLIEMYDQAPPIWGQIVREKPEEELQELKRSQAAPSILGQKVRQQAAQQQQPLPQKRQRPAIGRVVTTPYPSISSLSSLSPPSVSSSSLPPSSASVAAAKVQQPQLNLFTSSSSSTGGVGVGGGQKEVALLRPPTKSRVHSPPQSSASSSSAASMATTGIDTGIISASERQKKPSAYDTLRKYLSLEDALKKEEEKRRVGGGRPQQQKRSSGNSNFVAEEGSLIGQLSNLNKSMA